MTPSRRSLLGAAPGLWLASASSSPALAAGSGAALSARSVAQDVMASASAPAISGAVFRRGKPVWAEAFGWADLELKLAATPTSRFRIGSVSKVVCATLAARLVERGVLDLDRPISGYLPELPAAHRATTLRQLFAHLGGVRHYIARDFDPKAAGGPIDLRQYRTRADVLAVFVDDPLVAPPGERQSYSTFGFTLAGLAIEAVTGHPLPELVRSEVAEPLQIRIEADVPANILADRVRPYALASAISPPDPLTAGKLVNAAPINPAYKWAGGGLIASPADLARFGSALLAPGYLKPETLQLMFTPVPPRTGGVIAPVGMAWRVDRDTAGRRRLHHAGSIEGGRAALVIYPDQQLVVALAANLQSAMPDPLTPAGRLASLFAA
jgi:serine beta-lactamase-like protein LACTB